MEVQMAVASASQAVRSSGTTEERASKMDREGIEET